MSKIKAIDPKIVVNGNVDKPYYSIEYYNILDERWYIGYGSYNLKFVKEWLNDDFETVEADIAPVRHGYWIKRSQIIACYECSECHRSIDEEPHYDYSDNIMVFPKYCEYCGARMDKTE